MDVCEKGSKVHVRKDLFGAHNAENETTEDSQSALGTIWGESEDFAFTQPTSHSLLLSPALKRNPNRFSTSPSPKKSPGTPKKNSSTPQKKYSSPKKLSKYSPFRKKVHNPNPKDSIKNFFPVKDKHLSQDTIDKNIRGEFGITRLCEAGPSTSASTSHGNDPKNDMQNSKENIAGSNNILLGDGSPENSRFNTPKKTTPETSPPKSNSSTPKSAKKSLSPTSKINTGPKDVYGNFLLTLSLQIMMIDLLGSGVKLFSDEECSLIETFNKLDSPSQRLYGRLLNRKHDWIRTSSMKYGDVTLELILLNKKGFITSDCSCESLQTLLNLLTMPEIKSLCKSYKLPESGVKADLITRLISRTKQPSVMNYFTKASSTSTTSSTSTSDAENNMRLQIYKQLGAVVKLQDDPRRTFSRLLLFFSYPHYYGMERDRFADQLALVSHHKNVSFPSYNIVRTTIFHSREHFLIYEAAVIDTSELMELKEDKLWEQALEKIRQIVQKLSLYLNNEEIRREVEAMPDFLRRYTAGGCYVRAVSAGVDVFKHNNMMEEAEAGLELLLGQRLFCRHRRGDWFEQLAKLYERNFKDNVKACQVVLRGLRDEYIDEVSRHALCARAAMLEGRKKNGLRDYLKDALAAQRGKVDSLEEPPTVTISEQSLENFRPGLKKVYVQNAEDGSKIMSSVEEVALEHFKRNGYEYGCHDEGSIIKSIVFACFWQEIYGETEVDGHGLFHSEFQTAPLDWNSETFYDRRREKIKSKLQDLAEVGVEAVIQHFHQCYQNNVDTESVVNWSFLKNNDVVESLIRSIDIDVFLNLSRLLLRNHRIYSAGFPDLTLWNPKESKCLFVEVKSPNDQLSMKQRAWLHRLNEMGASAVVCRVHSVGSKAQKRKLSLNEDVTSAS